MVTTVTTPCRLTREFQKWETLGRILQPDRNIHWLSTWTGSSCALRVDETSLFDIYVTGRDSANRSLIGRIRIDIENPTELLEITSGPALSVGELGAFDENGVSYPYLVEHNDKVFMYYTGWMPTVLTPFQNHLGLAVQTTSGVFARASRAPLLERNDDDYLSIGSACVIVESGVWRMWYTSFRRWATSAAQPKHNYIIKYAESGNGINWVRRNQICIDAQNEGEHSIARPTVLKVGGVYHMWYCYRGDEYRIGYAQSANGINWERRDDYVGLQPSKEGWDTDSQCYPHVFRYGNYLYMLYNGNDYGRDGLGLARLKIFLS